MKFSRALTSLILLVPLFAGEVLGAAPYRRAQNNNKNGNGGNNGGNKNNNAVSSAAVSSAAAAVSSAAAVNSAAAAVSSAAAVDSAAANTASAAAAANTAAAAANAAANTTAANAAANNGDPQTSLTLDPGVIAQGFANDGQNPPVAGQIASLTSTNNFINFCLTVPNLPITNGQQIKTGSCNPAPMGVIAATTNMPSSKFVSPVNGQNIQANTAFTISMAVNNLETGNFVNAKTNYYAGPQQVNAQGTIIGHTHFTVQDVGSFTSTTPQDPNVFAFFKGVNGAAVNGVVSESVANGLPDGVYRVCSINTDANHMPCLVAVAQHGTLDDCVYFSIGNAGNNNPFGNGAAAANGTAAGNAGNAGNGTGSAAASSAAPAASSAVAPAASSAVAPAASGASSAAPAASSAAAAAGNGGKNGKNRNGNNRKNRNGNNRNRNGNNRNRNGNNRNRNGNSRFFGRDF